jgi:hypothetical protein
LVILQKGGQGKEFFLSFFFFFFFFFFFGGGGREVVCLHLRLGPVPLGQVEAWRQHAVGVCVTAGRGGVALLQRIAALRHVVQNKTVQALA